jgi:dTDP-4-dehydrorhamnose reductase
MRNNKKHRVFITGCGGMLGEAFYHYFEDKSTLRTSDIDINEEWLTYLDVRDYDEYRKQILDFKADICIHLAALTDLEYCELHPQEAYNTNTIAVENSVFIAKDVGATLVYISTAGIFNGKKEFYDDWDTPDPINTYGRSKYMGELFVEKNFNKYFVCRAGWMMGGGSKKDKKFVNKIMKQIESGKVELNVVDDKLGTPTYTCDFARNVFELLKTPFYGVYNMVCSDNCSRYDVATEIVSILNRTGKIKINKVKSDFFSDEYFAPRPPSEKLINTKLQLRGLKLQCRRV